MADQKANNRERVKEIVASIESGIKDLFQSEQYAQYLSTMSRFHNYSYRNTLLIHMQRPDATLVAGFNKWKNQFGRHVKKGEKGITILAPTPFKKKIEEQKLNPDTKVPVLDADGNIVTEEREIQIPMFRPVKVFDVKQTDGKPLPNLAMDLTGNVRHYEAFLDALLRTSPVPIDFKPIAADMDGYFRTKEQRITIRDDMSEIQTVSAVVHEITHAILHNQKGEQRTAEVGMNEAELPKSRDKKTEEVEAESVSYAVCQYFGIETSTNSLGYIATWSSGKELPELKASLETISKTADALITSIDRHFAEICKERGIVLEQAEQNVPSAEVPTNNQVQSEIKETIHEVSFIPEQNEGLFLVDNSAYLHIQKGDGVYDYTIYDKETMRQLDGGQFTVLSATGNFSVSLRENAAGLFRDGVPNVNLEGNTVEEAPLELVGTLQDAAMREMREAASRMKSGQEPEVLPDGDTRLDEYPMPDPAYSRADMDRDYAYLEGYLIPISKNKAEEFMERDFPIYAIVNEYASMVFDREELDALPSDTVCSIITKEWEASPDFRQAVADRLNHQEEREAAFLNHAGDCFAIYQMPLNEETRFLRFESMGYLREHGLTADRSKYDFVYTAPLAAGGITGEILDGLWERFNTDHPADYCRPSMSVSDIVALKLDGVVSCHYCDSVGFVELPGFIQPENYLKAAELSLEDDCNMIDGIINNGPKQPTVAELEAQAKSGQTISLMDLYDAIQREQREKKSVVAQLKGKSMPERPKKAPQKSREKER